LLVLAACGAEPTPAPATVQAAATAIAPTVAGARTQVAGTAQTGATAIVGTVQTGATAVAPTVAAAQTQIAPTVAAAQATVAAASTQLAPTIAAANTQVAPTIAAVQTQVAATFGPPVASTVAESPVQITAASVSQEDTTIVVTNSGTAEASISAWILMLGTFPFVLPASPNLRIQPGQSVTLHLARGEDTATDVYLGQAPQPLVNSLTPGTRIALINLRGQVASVYVLP
jgi:hypothetical protein